MTFLVSGGYSRNGISLARLRRQVWPRADSRHPAIPPFLAVARCGVNQHGSQAKIKTLMLI